MKSWQKILISTLGFALVLILLRKVIDDEFNNQIIAQAIITSILFSTLLVFFGGKIAKRATEKLLKTIPDIELTNGEKLLLQGPASHFKGVEAVGGKLALTDKRLFFRSHQFNVQNHQLEIPLERIGNAVQGEWIYKKTFVVELTTKETQRFLVDRPADWIKMLREG